MNRNTFREFLHTVFKMTDDILMDRIFKVFDTLNNGLITREEWIMGLNIFLRGALLFLCLICKYCLRFSPISLTRQYRWTNKVLLHNLRPQCRRVKSLYHVISIIILLIWDVKVHQQGGDADHVEDLHDLQGGLCVLEVEWMYQLNLKTRGVLKIIKHRGSL